MPRIRCHYMDCLFIENGHCSADSVEVDPETGCVTYSPSDDLDDWIGEGLDDWDTDDDEEDGFFLEDEDDL